MLRNLNHDNHTLNRLLKPGVVGKKKTGGKKETNLHTFVGALPSEPAPLKQTARLVNEEYLGALVHF